MISEFTLSLKKHGIEFSNSQLELLEQFYDLLILENKKYNLTSITEKDKVYSHHFFDSLTVLPYIPENSSIIDIGAGGGFPSIPIKIFRPDINITMLDSVRKKVNFLNLSISSLGLNNSRALHIRAEDLAKTKERESFDFSIARAVASLPTLLEYALPLTKIGGFFIAYKSNVDNELLQSKKALSLLGGEIEKIISTDEYDLTRNLIFVKKVFQTPSKYPRGKNKERLDPLV